VRLLTSSASRARPLVRLHLEALLQAGVLRRTPDGHPREEATDDADPEQVRGAHRQLRADPGISVAAGQHDGDIQPGHHDGGPDRCHEPEAQRHAQDDEGVEEVAIRRRLVGPHHERHGDHVEPRGEDPHLARREAPDEEEKHEVVDRDGAQDAKVEDQRRAAVAEDQRDQDREDDDDETDDDDLPFLGSHLALDVAVEFSQRRLRWPGRAGHGTQRSIGTLDPQQYTRRTVQPNGGRRRLRGSPNSTELSAEHHAHHDPRSHAR
jgi:hypothetical protein